MGLFKPAIKQSAKLRLAITGPAGSGKTYTALAIAETLAAGAPIAVVDTEHGSASKYADLFAFDVAEMHAPFHPDKFIAALREAEAAGYGAVILDSISHAWSGSGGVLDLGRKQRSPRLEASGSVAATVIAGGSVPQGRCPRHSERNCYAGLQI